MCLPQVPLSFSSVLIKSAASACVLRVTMTALFLPALRRFAFLVTRTHSTDALIKKSVVWSGERAWQVIAKKIIDRQYAPGSHSIITRGFMVVTSTTGQVVQSMISNSLNRAFANLSL